MNAELGSHSCFAVNLAVGTSVAIKVTASIVVPETVGFAEILLWLCYIWTTAKACLIRKTSRTDENASSSEEESCMGNDWPCQQDYLSEKRSVEDEELFLLVAVVYSKGLASLAENVDINTSFKVYNNRVMEEKQAVFFKSLTDPTHTFDQLSLDLNKQHYRLKQSVHGGDKQNSSSSKAQANKGTEMPRGRGCGSRHGIRTSGWGGSSGDDGGEDGDKRQKQTEKWVSPEWRTDVRRQAEEETKEDEQQIDSVEGTDEDASNYGTADVLHMTSSPVDIELQRRPRDTPNASLVSVPLITPIIRSMPDPQPHSLQLSTAHPRPKHTVSRRASFSQMLPSNLVRQKQQKNVGISKATLEGSVESRVMTLELAFQCQFRNGHEQWKVCSERGCRCTREQLEHYGHCVLRQFGKTVGVDDCHRCTNFLMLIWRHAENCSRTEKCPVFKCHEMKIKPQVAAYAPFPITTPHFSANILTAGDLSSGCVPAIEPSNAMHSSPVQSPSQNRPGQVKEQAQSWPSGVGPLLQQVVPPVVQRRLSDLQYLPQLTENVSFPEPTAECSSSISRSATGEFKEESPGIFHLTGDETSVKEPVSQTLRSGETVLQPLQVEPVNEIFRLPTADVLQSLIPGYSEQGAETEFKVLWPLNEAILTPVDGRYVAREHFIESALLGQGAFAEVWLAIDVASSSLLAVKKPFAQDSLKERELSIWGKLDHHNFVELFGAVQHGQKTYIFQEYVEGGSLSNLLFENGCVSPLPEILSLVYCFQVLQGLTYLHDTMEVVHRDIKPENVLVKENNLIKIADFGLAIAVSDVPLDVDRSFHPAGTDCYMPPEAARGEIYFPNRDVWSVGCLLLKLLTGKAPYYHLRHMPSLIFVIGNSKAPEVPANCCSEAVRSFFSAVFVPAADRPSAVQLLMHIAFSQPFEALDTPQAPEPPPLGSAHCLDTEVSSQSVLADPAESGDDGSIAVSKQALTISTGELNIDESPVMLQSALTGSESAAGVDRELDIRSNSKTPRQIKTVDLETSPAPFVSPPHLFGQLSVTRLNQEINQPVESIHHEGLDPSVETQAQSTSSTVPSSTHSVTPMSSISSTSARNESTSTTASIEVGSDHQTNVDQLYNQQPSDVAVEPMKPETSTDQRQAVAEKVDSYIGESTGTHEPSEEPSNTQSAENMREEYHPARSPRSEESTTSLASEFSCEDAKAIREYSQYQIEKGGTMSRRASTCWQHRCVVRSTSTSGMQVHSEVFAGSGASGRHQRVQRSVSVSRPVLTRHDSQAADAQWSGVHRSSQHHSRQHVDGREQYGQRGNRDGQSNVSNTSSSFTTAPNASSAIEEVSQKRTQLQQRRVAVEQAVALPLSQAQNDVRDEFKGKSPLDGNPRAFESGQQREETGSYCDWSRVSDALQAMDQMVTAKGQVVAAPTEHTEMEPGEMAFGATSGFLRATVSAQHSSRRLQIPGPDYPSAQDELQQTETDGMRHWPQRSGERPPVRPEDQPGEIQPAVIAEAAAPQLGCIRVGVFDYHLPTKPLFTCKTLIPEMSAAELAKYLQATVRTKMPVVRSFTLGLVHNDGVIPLDKKKHFHCGTDVKVAIVPMTDDPFGFNSWFLDEGGNIHEAAKSPMSSLV